MKFGMTAGFVAGLLATPAAASAILDANYQGTNNWLAVRSGVSHAQTFSVQNTGLMTSVELFVFNYQDWRSQPNADLRLQVRKVVGGTPSEAQAGSDVLATVSLTHLQVPDAVVSGGGAWTVFDVPDFYVYANEQLALVLTSATTANDYYWNGNLDWPALGYPPSNYSDGQLFMEGAQTGSATWVPEQICGNGFGCSNPQASDLAFRTYVDTDKLPPLPHRPVPEPGVWSLMLLGFGAAGAAMRRRRQSTHSTLL